MTDSAEQNVAVKAKVVLIDAASMTVVWMNESALRDIPDRDANDVRGLPVPEAVPLAEVLGVPKALLDAAATGVAQHLRADLVSTSKGRMAIVASVYRLPDERLLLVIENAWQPEHRTRHASDPQRHRRGSR